MRIQKVFVFPSWKTLQFFLVIGIVVGFILYFAEIITDPVKVLAAMLAVACLSMFLHLIGFYRQFQGWDVSWRGKVENDPSMIFDCICSGIFAIFGAVWAATKAVINKGEEFIKQRDHTT